MKFNSLVTKVFLGLAFVTFVVMGGYAAYQVTNVEAGLRENNNELHRVIVSGTLSPLSVGLWNFDNTIVSTIVRSMFEHGQIQKIQVYRDFSGLPLMVFEKTAAGVSQLASATGTPFEQLKISATDASVGAEGSANDFSQNSLAISDREMPHSHRLMARIYFQNDKEAKQVGVLAVDFTSLKALQYIAKSKRIVVYFTLGSTLIMLLLSFLFLRRSVLNPIATIARASLQAAKGNYALITSVKSKDEIGILAENFNLMMNEIRSNTENREHVIRIGREISSQVTLNAISDKVGQAAAVFGGAEVQSEIYYSHSCFMDKQLQAGFYPLKGQQDVAALKPVSAQNIVKSGGVDIQILDPRNMECLAIVALKNRDLRDLGQATPNMRAICNNMASAITTVRLEQILQLLDLRTRELRSIFSNINQGICTVDSSLIVSAEYSKALEAILDQKELRARPFLDILLEKTEFSADVKSQIRTSFENSLNENILTFDVNSDSLPREFVFQKSSGKAYLEADWLPIVDSDNVVKTIMVTLKDVTILKQLNANSEAIRREMVMIHQIFGIPSDDFNRFMVASNNYLKDITETIARGSFGGEPGVVLKRNIHTLKGNSRTFGFTFLSDSVHEVENAVFEIAAANEPSVPGIQAESLSKKLENLKNELHRYQDIEREICGRGKATWDARMKIVHSAASDCKEILDSPNSDERLLTVYQKLMAVERPQISAVMRALGSSATSLAADLGKAQPAFEYKSDLDSILEVEMTELISASLMHLVRNSVDHGFKGEMPFAIKITAKWNQDSPKLVYADSGVGLDLAKLKQIGLDGGMISSGASDLEIASLIFQSGISTAAQITHISGRGVGMDFVSQGIRGAGGSLELRLIGSKSEDNRQKFEIHFTIPKEKVLVLI